MAENEGKILTLAQRYDRLQKARADAWRRLGFPPIDEESGPERAYREADREAILEEFRQLVQFASGYPRRVAELLSNEARETPPPPIGRAG